MYLTFVFKIQNRKYRTVCCSQSCKNEKETFDKNILKKLFKQSKVTKE